MHLGMILLIPHRVMWIMWLLFVFFLDVKEIDLNYSSLQNNRNTMESNLRLF